MEARKKHFIEFTRHFLEHDLKNEENLPERIEELWASNLMRSEHISEFYTYGPTLSLCKELELTRSTVAASFIIGSFLGRSEHQSAALLRKRVLEFRAKNAAP
jgi:hypothetical protein